MTIRWYVDRLRSMSLAEIVHRIGEAAKRSVWRFYRRGWSDFDIGDGPLPIIPELGNRLETAVTRNKTLRKRIADECAQLLSGEVSFLNRRWPEGTLKNLHVGDPELFLRDPVTGRRWPKVEAYCFDVPYRHNSTTGDVKYIWEINRLQFLQVAAAEARLTNNSILANKILDLILAWMKANPPFLGINWCSGIELALRIVAIVIVLSFLGDVKDQKIRIQLRAFIYAHAFWLARYPSLFSSANNHLISEALGVFLAGTLVPDLPHARQFMKHGRRVLEEEIQKQILDDGVGVEQSVTYTAFTIEMCALAELIGEMTGNPFSQEYKRRLAASADFMCWLVDGSGNTPSIGDNDEGRVITLSLNSELQYVASVAASVGGLLNQTRFMIPRRAPELREAIFDVSDETEAPVRTGLRTFETGGYTVVRENHAGQPTLLVFDHGPLGYLSIAAHGHDDALSVWLHVGGLPVFIDAGTYFYHVKRTQRDFFRSTAAHNTLTVEGESGNISTGPFQWFRKGDARLYSSQGTGDWWVEGLYEGYKTRFNVVHSRRIIRTSYGFNVVDRLNGAGLPRAVSARFLLAPDLTALREGNRWVIRLPNQITVVVEGPEGFNTTKERANVAVPAGWASMFFGDRRPTDQLLFNGILGADEVTTKITITDDR